MLAVGRSKPGSQFLFLVPNPSMNIDRRHGNETSPEEPVGGNQKRRAQDQQERRVDRVPNPLIGAVRHERLTPSRSGRVAPIRSKRNVRPLE